MIVTVGELFYESVLSTKILVPGGNKKIPRRGGGQSRLVTDSMHLIG